MTPGNDHNVLRNGIPFLVLEQPCHVILAVSRSAHALELIGRGKNARAARMTVPGFVGAKGGEHILHGIVQHRKYKACLQAVLEKVVVVAEAVPVQASKARARAVGTCIATRWSAPDLEMGEWIFCLYTIRVVAQLQSGLSWYWVTS